MGITTVHKSDPRLNGATARKALVLSGGAVTGGSFKVGGLKALNDYLVNFSINDFDIFVGISSGSLLAPPLAAGLTPEMILRSLDGTSTQYSKLAPWHFYWPNWQEFISRPLQFGMESLTYLPRILVDLFSDWRVSGKDIMQQLLRLIRSPSLQNYEALLRLMTAAITSRELPSLLRLFPTGMFDNSPIERYMRHNIIRNHLTNNFELVQKMRGKQLYICSMTLDLAERVVFGPDERNDVTISEAVQASTALPFFYKPARIKGVDYVDGGVFETAHIDVAVAKGAELIICYNPFRPVENRVFGEYIRRENRYVTRGNPLAMGGIITILNQIFRSVFFTRLHQTIDHYRQDPQFKGDIILIEPSASDMNFFEMNPLIYSNRIKAARIGFESVRNSIDGHYKHIEAILSGYGIKMSRDRVDGDMAQLKTAGRDARAMQKVLEGRTRNQKKRKGKP